MNNTISFVSLISSVLLFSAACSDDDKGGGGDVDASTTQVDGGNADGGPTVDAMPTPDARPAPDAMPAALACAGDPLPVTVDSPPIVLAGNIQEVTAQGVSALAASAHISTHFYADDALIAEGDFTGTFSLTDPQASTAPLDAYLKATVPNYLDTYIFPGAALSESFANAPLTMISNSIFGLLSLLTGVTNVDGTGTFIAAITDCNDNPIEGAVVTITPDVGVTKYAGAMGLPGQDDFPSTQAAGVVYFFNVPPGEYTISAVAADGTDLRDNLVKSYADSLGTILVIP